MEDGILFSGGVGFNKMHGSFEIGLVYLLQFTVDIKFSTHTPGDETLYLFQLQFRGVWMDLRLV